MEEEYDCISASVRPMESLTLIFSTKRQIFNLAKKLIKTMFTNNYEELGYFIRITPAKMKLVS